MSDYYHDNVITFHKVPKITTDGPSSSYLLDIQDVIPTSSDYAVVYSTLHGCASFRHTEMGSVFIRHLCSFLKPEFARDHDFMTILELLTEKIKDWHYTKEDDEIINSKTKEVGIKYVTQVPEVCSTLSKKVYFDIV